MNENRKVMCKLTGQKAFVDVLNLEVPLYEELKRLALKHEGCFGKTDDPNTFSYMLVNNALDKNSSTVKLKCKDSAKMALDISLPLNQAEAELAKISGTPELDITLAGVVGSNRRIV